MKRSLIFSIFFGFFLFGHLIYQASAEYQTFSHCEFGPRITGLIPGTVASLSNAQSYPFTCDGIDFGIIGLGPSDTYKFGASASGTSFFRQAISSSGAFMSCVGYGKQINNVDTSSGMTLTNIQCPVFYNISDSFTGTLFLSEDFLISSTGSWSQIYSPDETLGNVMQDIRLYLLFLCLGLMSVISYFVISHFIGKK